MIKFLKSLFAPRTVTDVCNQFTMQLEVMKDNAEDDSRRLQQMQYKIQAKAEKKAARSRQRAADADQAATAIARIEALFGVD